MFAQGMRDFKPLKGCLLGRAPTTEASALHTSVHAIGTWCSPITPDLSQYSEVRGDVPVSVGCDDLSGMAQVTLLLISAIV